ncbi:RND family transporter [Mycobacterium paraseoulense]|uniref:MMPL/RND family transporter n=1 Tax=Mycobacterium paraseoulense TaxID=590652 RepID=UPI0009F3C19A|nr:MMPL family transporter [Mycobacterium paraseoulense]MCV7396646.1 MMPL family transporter [Mycobacterium paraseoulense]BBZ72549.1 putative transport protein MmpL8 [Mycobacterium paraseoulense]
MSRVKTGRGNPVGLFPRLGHLVGRRPWLVIGVWSALACVLALTAPSLEEISQQHPVAILPADAPVLSATRTMNAAFGEAGLQSIAVVVLSDANGLSAADEGTYRKLVEALRRDTRDVAMVQDFVATPPVRDLMTSKDHRAWMLPVGLPGDLGSPQSKQAYARVATIVKQTVAGSTLTVNLTGPASTVADLNVTGQRDRTRIELAIVALLFVILLVIYRNPVTMVLPLLTIGMSAVVAQRVVALVGLAGLGIANQTVIFMSGLMVGAGTDYAVFLISRYHDHVRQGMDSDQAVIKALASIGKVIAASAATVAVTFLGMVFTQLGILRTVGPVLGISVAVVFIAAITLLPALLVLAGRRGWIAPRDDLSRRFWRRSGVNIVRRPKTHLLASLLVLVILAGCAGLARYNYDDRKALPGDVESSVGYAALAKHFSTNLIVPEYLFISSPQDLRTARALADLEQMAQRVSQVPGVAMVRGITRPTGQSLEQAKTSWQAGEVGGKLDAGSKQIADHTGDLDRLAGGANVMAGKLGDVRTQVNQAVSAVGGLVDALATLQNIFGGNRALAELEGAERLVDGMRSLGDAIGANANFVANNSDWANPVLGALDNSPMCGAEPACVNAREELRRLVTARDDGTLGKISELARQLRATQAVQTLAATVSGLRRALSTVVAAMGSLGMGSPGGMRAKITFLQQGTNSLADGSRQLADGVQQLVDQVKKMGFGMSEASAFLLSIKKEATTPAMAGFYIPAQALSYATGEGGKPEVLPGGVPDLLGGMSAGQLKRLAAAFVSPDGHAMRYLIQTDLDPFGTAAMDQVDAIKAAAQGARPNTTLADAKVSVVGLPVVLKETRDYYRHDLRLIIVMTICVVLVILIALLRAVIAPLYLVGTVILSYMSAIGIGVIVFQFLLGQEMHWSVPGLTFIILVAVGADYNMLLISRLRDESVWGMRSGVIRTVSSTGGVITAAGLIMAASMYGLVFATLSTVIQSGFVLGTGLLLDTFLVRTVTVPAIAVLVGRANWWRPPGWAAAARWPLWRRRGPVKRKPLLPDEERSPAWTAEQLVGFSPRDGLRL